MTLPAITTVQVATVPLAAFLSRQAAVLASSGSSTPLPEIDFTGATVILGDGNTGGGATVPAISTLQSTRAVTHEVWRGQIVQAVTVDASNANAVDVLCVVPAVDSGGAEIGPFYVTEFIVTDEAGTPMIAGTTLMPKLVTANGTAVDLAFIASVGFSLGTVVLTPPSAAFVSMSQVQTAFNANLPTASSPIGTADAITPQGWKHRNFSLPAAARPADPVSAPRDAAAWGYSRAASDDEFAAGQAASASVFKAPYPTLEQIHAAFAALANRPYSETHADFNVPGTYTWRCPAGVTRLKQGSVWGGAGGGGGLGSTNNGAGGGGGGGGYDHDTDIPVTPGADYTVVVGDEGAPGGVGATAGAAGGRSSFSLGATEILAATGGEGGGAGGGGVSGFGGVGGVGLHGSTRGRGASGGAGSLPTGPGGPGGGAPFGGAGAGGGMGGAGDGAKGAFPGGGGGGCGSATAATAVPGAAGCVRLEW